MGNITLLDCTLRDGGYINNWCFGKDAITDIIKKLEQTGIEMIEVGFIKGDSYNPERTIFPDIESFKTVLINKKPDVTYVGMIDMNHPVPLDRIPKYDGTSIDGIRVIFKKHKREEAFEYCRQIKELGYKLYVNLVNTDLYSDKEYIDCIEKFNALNPTGITIVDTFGTIKKKDFRRWVSLADNNLKKGIALCYHGHNNLQQAFGNAVEMVDMNLDREIVIDACVFGMGRGAGNLNLELFADHLNESGDKNYSIAPMLEIMDRHLSKFYKSNFWGYSLPLYLSASHGCHPEYATYYAEKNTLSEKAMDELFRSLPSEEKIIFNKDTAEKYYQAYLNNAIDDTKCVKELSEKLSGKKVLMIAPGKSIKENAELIKNASNKGDRVVFMVNFFDEEIKSDYLFVSNTRRFDKLEKNIGKVKNVIATSNIRDAVKSGYVINFYNYFGKDFIYDNSCLILLRFLMSLGITDIQIAGMDGYSKDIKENYFDNSYELEYQARYEEKNELVSKELTEIMQKINIDFITPTKYTFN